MVNIDALTDEQFDALTDKALEIFYVVAQEGLALNDENQYARLVKLTENDQYTLAFKWRNLNDKDEFDADLDIENAICAEAVFLGIEEEQMLNEVHVANIIFSKDEDMDGLSVSWFPED